VELVIQPSLLEQLARMAGGYTTTEGERVRAGTATAAAAAAELDVLRQVAAAPGVRVIALPFAGATVPSLISSGLTGDVSVQRDLGDETVRDLLGVTPSTAVVRPTNGDLSAPAVAAMADAGATVLLVDSDTVDRPVQPNEFAPLPTATLASEGRTVAAVLPDPGTQTLIGSPAFEGDPVRAAQATLGELATIWREQPVPTLPRGVAILLPSSLQAGFWNPFLRRVAEAPFLSPQPADDLIDLVPPPDSASELAHPSTSSFTSGYADSIKDERRNVAALRSMLSLANPLANRLSRNLLYAESVAYLGAEESGRLWIDHVHDRAFETFEAAAPDTSQVFTFLQRSGTIPIQMGDPGPTPIRVMLQLRSAQFQFPDGDQQTVTLTQPDQIVTFHATATTSGRSQIQVIVRAPSGRPIEQGILVVRTTAVNRIALIITVAAALVLVALWSRRYLQRPTT
jgi:hypothetical protein